MFTGIITDVGTVTAVHDQGDEDRTLTIATAYLPDTIAIGASIACNGICLTVIARGAAAGRETGGDGTAAPADRNWFSVQASGETLACTTAGGWRPGTRINLERALRLGDELGGHLVSGHVDGVARVVALRPEGESLRVGFAAPAQLARFIAPKGSVALDGISLTVNDVDGAEFGVNLIPHTLGATTFGGLVIGQMINLEIDLLARYVARLNEMAGT